MNATNRLSSEAIAINIPSHAEMVEAEKSLTEPGYAEALAAYRATPLPETFPISAVPEGMDMREAMRQAIGETDWAQSEEPNLPEPNEWGL